jgi:SAM-dependent methyltransferase
MYEKSFLEHRKEFEEYYGGFGNAGSRFQQYKKSGVGPFTYFFFYERKLALVRNKVLASIRDDEERRVLDAGCGTGDFLLSLKRGDSRPFVVGVELSWKQVIKARTNLVKPWRAEFCQCYGEFLPFSDEVFDCAVSLDVIEHVVDPRQYIEEVMRVLKTGGRLVITTDNPNSCKPEFDQHYHYVLLNRVKYKLKDSWVGITQMLEIVGQHGLMIDHGYYRINYKLISLFSHIANRLPLRGCAIIARCMILFEETMLKILSEKKKSRRCLFQYAIFEKK